MEAAGAANSSPEPGSAALRRLGASRPRRPWPAAGWCGLETPSPGTVSRYETTSPGKFSAEGRDGCTRGLMLRSSRALCGAAPLDTDCVLLFVPSKNPFIRPAPQDVDWAYSTHPPMRDSEWS